MGKNQKRLHSLKNLGKLLPGNKRSRHQEEMKHGKHFQKEIGSFRAQLANARKNNNKRFEVINLTKLGTLYRKYGEYDEAIKYFKQTLEIDKENAYALDGLGMAYFKMDDYDHAIKWFQKQFNPIVAMNNLCRAYRAKGDYDRAIEYAEIVLDKDSEDMVAMNELGINHRLKKE